MNGNKKTQDNPKNSAVPLRNENKIGLFFQIGMMFITAYNSAVAVTIKNDKIWVTKSRLKEMPNMTQYFGSPWMILNKLKKIQGIMAKAINSPMAART